MTEDKKRVLLVMYDAGKWPNDDILKLLHIIEDAFGVTVAAVPMEAKPISLDEWINSLETITEKAKKVRDL